MPFTQILTTFAADACYDTILFGKVCDDCHGGAVMAFVALFLRVLTAGMLVAATIGVIWTGALILTARENAEQVTKAKRRLSEIVIGLACWVLLASIVSFVLPGGDLNKMINPDEVVACKLADPPAEPEAHVTSTPASPSTPSTPSTPSNPGTVSKNDRPIGPLTSPSGDVSCDPRTTFYKKYTNAHINKKKMTVTLCKVPNITGDNIVNSRVSGAYYAFAAAYKQATGKTLHSNSGFRSYERQKYLYDHGYPAAKPGTSNHEGGYAIDFQFPEGSTKIAKVTSCPSTAKFPNVTDKGHSPNRWFYTEQSRYFCNNLSKYGLTRPYGHEVWHVQPTNYYLGGGL